jgi:hypothetical protein
MPGTVLHPDKVKRAEGLDAQFPLSVLRAVLLDRSALRPLAPLAPEGVTKPAIRIAAG